MDRASFNVACGDIATARRRLNRRMPAAQSRRQQSGCRGSRRGFGGIRSVSKLLLVLCFGWTHGAAGADETNICVVCKQALKEKGYLIKSPKFRERQIVCALCEKLDTWCTTCQLPVKTNYLKLEDGRLLCEADAKAAVFSEAVAREIFAAVTRDLVRMLSGLGVAPERNIEVALVDEHRLEKLYRTELSDHERTAVLGLARTRARETKEFEHSIFLLNGLSPAQLAAVAAHEYTHTWLNENIETDRLRHLEDDTKEGFCELLAYKLMIQRNEEMETNAILANAYTQGQIDALIKAEQDYQLYQVVKWLKRGVDDRIALTNTARLLVLEDQPALTLTWPTALSTKVPAQLTLKGISGNDQRRFALVNDRTLEKNEQAQVRVGNSNLIVRCLEIRDASVILQLNGSAEKTELFLRPAK